MTGSRLDRAFVPAALATCAAYLVAGLAYAWRLPLVVDELQGAWSARQLLGGVPHRDFVPYKTVLGYALQAVPLALVEDHWTSLHVARAATVAAIAVLLVLAALSLRRSLRPAAALGGLVLLVASSTWLERSVELRTDALAGATLMLGLALLLERKLVAAGLALGLAFLVSQKAAGGCLAAGVAVVAAGLHEGGGRALARDVLRLAAGGLAPVAAYVALLAPFSSVRAVIDGTFFSAVGFVAVEVPHLDRFWRQELTRSPAHAALALACVAVVVSRGARRSWRDAALAVFGVVVLAFTAWLDQPWPYSFTLVLPVTAVMGALVIEALLDLRRGARAAALAALALAGVAWPLSRVPHVLKRDDAVLLHCIRVAEAVVGEGEPYLAGVELLRDRRQAPAELWFVDRVLAEQLSERDAPRLVAALEADPPKALVWNYRLGYLPRPVKEWLAARYVRVSGHVMVRATDVPPGDAAFAVRFGGRHVVEASAPVEIDGVARAPGERVTLLQGEHSARSEGGFRVLPLPEEAEPLLDPRFRDPPPLFLQMYEY